jgi:hypothetical protein
MHIRKRCVLAVVLCCLSCVAHARSPERVEAFAALPRWEGIWEAEPFADRAVSGRPVGGVAQLRAKSMLSRHPPYNVQWEARYQETLKNESLRQAMSLIRTCSFGFPRVMESPAVFQVLITPEETLFAFETQDVRHIRTDGRGHPAKEDLWPTRMGDSIGRWEGDTLVIETIGRLATAPISMSAWAAKLSPQARFIERIRQIGPDRLENRMTIEDPVAFSHSWELTLSYRRVTGLDRIVNYDCDENERNPVIDGKITITPRRLDELATGTQVGATP